MSEIVLKNAVTREPGYLYFVDSCGNVCRALLARGRKKKNGKN